jgi:hypothetical protein
VLCRDSDSFSHLSPSFLYYKPFWAWLDHPKMPPDMRGLTQVRLPQLLPASCTALTWLCMIQYIADLRGCRIRELEEKRINKEMAHIRQKFKGALALLCPPDLTDDFPR